MEELEPITELKKIEGAIEAILFAAGHPMEYTKIAETLSLTPRDTRRIAEHMAEARNADETSGIMMLLFDETCQLCTRETYLPYIRYALGIKRGGTISPSAMEALAVIAYNQPVTRSFVDKVRGVDSAYAVNTLVDRELIAEVGRLDAPGRPMLFGTTEKFLRVFGLTSIADLPENGSVEAAMAAVIAEGTGGNAPAPEADLFAAGDDDAVEKPATEAGAPADDKPAEAGDGTAAGDDAAAEKPATEAGAPADDKPAEAGDGTAAG